MAKGYLMGSTLQTKLAMESSIFNVTFIPLIVAATCQDHVQTPLTMNSVARHAVTD